MNTNIFLFIFNFCDKPRLGWNVEKYDVDMEGKLAEIIPVLMLLYEEGSTPKGKDTKKEQGQKTIPFLITEFVGVTLFSVHFFHTSSHSGWGEHSSQISKNPDKKSLGGLQNSKKEGKHKF